MGAFDVMTSKYYVRSNVNYAWLDVEVAVMGGKAGASEIIFRSKDIEKSTRIKWNYLQIQS